MHAFRTPRALLGAFLAFLLLPATLLAVQQGRITGKVTDGKGAALADVKITITTKAISNFKVELKTDKDGKWGTILNDATLHLPLPLREIGLHVRRPGQEGPDRQLGDPRRSAPHADAGGRKGVVKQSTTPSP